MEKILNNPYETPCSDIVIENSLTPKPKTVRVAVKLLWVSIGLGIIFAIADIYSDFNKAIPILLITFFSYGFFSLLIIMINKRKNWARFVFLIMFICGLAAMLYSSFFITELKANLLLIPITQTLLQLSSLIMLFRKPSSFWFNNNCELPMNKELQNNIKPRSKGYILGHFQGNKSLESAFWTAGIL